jgi:RHS repeat-associated protein
MLVPNREAGMSVLRRSAGSLRVRSFILGLLVLIPHGSALAAREANSSRPAPTMPKLGVAAPTTATQQLPAIRYVPGLEEPLVATGPAAWQDDQDLDAAIAAFRNPAIAPRDFADSAKLFIAFLAKHPGSPWRMAVETNLGIGYYHAGYFSRAFAAWEQAWRAGRNATSPPAKALADRAVGELARMHARVGHADALERLFAEVGTRQVSGPATEMITGAREGLWMFQHEPGVSYLCGPQALKNLLIALNADPAKIKMVDEARSGPHGFNLEQVARLADQAGLDSKLIYRVPEQPIPVPSIVNWKVHHYAAILGERDGVFHIADPTFGGGDLWVTKRAIDSEASGYFLVPAELEEAHSWRNVSLAEAGQVYGMGFTSTNQPGSLTPNDKNLHGCGDNGLCAADAKLMLVSLNLSDTPVGYQPPKGPAVRIRLTYNQREASQPANFGFFNVSPKWTLNFLSYIKDDPAAAGQSVRRYVAGGGSIDYSLAYTYDSRTGAFSPERQGQAVLVRIPAAGPVTSYELRLPDGGKQVFSHPDGATTKPRRIFLTQMVDSAGNALTLNYDNQLRLTSITDAAGRNTLFSYNLAAQPLLVTRITDPFGRHADLAYDANGRLASITDVLGLTSSFTYDAGGLVNAMTTPYGTSTFVYGQDTSPNVNSRFLEMTDPLGFTERLEFIHYKSNNTDNVTPAGLFITNNFLEFRNTFYWDKHVYPITHTDYTKARLTHWLHTPRGGYVETSPVVESTKQPLENRVWYTYPGQLDPIVEGTAATPTAIARVLDDGATQVRRFTYNRLGKPLTATDPLGRETFFTYDPNNDIDLLTIQQQTSAAGRSTIASFSYNNQHRPLTYTDAAGQVTRFAYNPAGQLTSVTDPLGNTTSYAYDTAGRLITITNANGARQESLTYDSFDRVATRTDSEGYVLTYSYDNLDRVTRIAYPDGTAKQYIYDKLDLASITDRLGRVTTFTYDANGRLTAVTDALGQTTRYEYYESGALKSLIDPKGNVTSWDIDIQSRPVAKYYANGTKETYAYENTTSRLESKSDALNQSKKYDYFYDDLVRSISYFGVINSTAAVSFAYDIFFPRLVRMTDGSGTTTLTYKAIGSPGALQLASENGPFGANDAIAYAYDALGRATTRTVDTAPETFVYDALGRLTQHGTALGIFSYAYLGQTGQLVNQALASPAISTSYAYDTNTNDRRLLSITNNRARSFQYTTNPESIITKSVESTTGAATPSTTWDYKYDDIYRLMTAQASTVTSPPSPPATMNYAYGYDTDENVISVQNPSGTESATYNNINEITVFNRQNFVYDANGNLLDDGARTYRWDAENRLISIQYRGRPTLTVFRYDGFGRRIAISENDSRTETHYLWCGETICQARDINDVVIRRYFPEGECPASGLSCSGPVYVRDHLGSVRNLVQNASGVSLPEINYDPYGNPSLAFGGLANFGYGGMFYHENSGLYLTHYRAYDPRISRWLSRDPIGEVGGINLYAYVGDNPILENDSTGLSGGPYHPPKGIKTSCTNADSDCPLILGKLQLLERMILSHAGWDRHVPSPRGGARHAQEIFELGLAWLNCLDIYQRNCKDCPPPPETLPIPELEPTPTPAPNPLAFGLGLAGVILYWISNSIVMVP